MKKIKLLVCVLLMLTCLSSSVMAYYKVTMYAPDGRSVSVGYYDVYAWKKVGWYDFPVTSVYSPDGRIEVISTDKVAEWKRVGWYDYPVTTVYAPDGRIEVISTDKVTAWQKVGWYTYPVIVVYAPDGRAEVISIDALYDWCNVGWYQVPVTTLYSIDGRTIVVPLSLVQDYLKVGWYTSQPALTLPFSEATEFLFASGTGSWATTMKVYPDGTFSGEFYDNDMGIGTIYTCKFNGKFGNIRMIDEYSYSMSLDTINLESHPGTEWYSNGIRYVASEAVGLDGGTEFIFYKTNTPSYYLPEEFKECWFKWNFANTKPTVLDSFGIYNIGAGCGFVSVR